MKTARPTKSKRAPAQTLSLMPLVAEIRHATQSGDEDRETKAYQALSAARIEREIVTAFETDHGLADEDRERLCALLHSRGGDVDVTT